MSAAIAVFAAIGFLVVVWCVVRLPFWIRDIRAEDREADRAFWAELRRGDDCPIDWSAATMGSWTPVESTSDTPSDAQAEYSTRAPGVYEVNGDEWTEVGPPS